MVCPYYKNKNVFDSFNKMVVAFGGDPMTEEEFRSSELRNQRTGSNFRAMELAYFVYNKNNGNFLDKTKDGNKSILFQRLLAKTNNDYYKAIKLKTYYSFLKPENEKGAKYDKNGEIILDGHTFDKLNSNRYDKLRSLHILGKEESDSLLQGNAVSSKNIIKNLRKNGAFSSLNKALSFLLDQHDIPVVLSDMEEDKLAVANVGKNGEVIIQLNQNILFQCSPRYISQKILHEVIHALTVSAIKNPKTAQEKSFAKHNKKLYDFLNKLFPETQFLRLNPYGVFYSLLNEYEFASEFATNEQVRQFVLDVAKKYDAENKHTLSNILKQFINSITSVLIDKKLFLNKTELYNKYVQSLQNHLQNINIVEQGNIKQEDVLQLLFNKVNFQQMAYEQQIEAQQKLQNILDNSDKYYSARISPILVSNESSNNLAEKTITQLKDYISNLLQLRIKAIQSSTLPKEFITRNEQQMRLQVSAFSSEIQNDLQVISQFVNTVFPQIVDLRNQVKEYINQDGTVKPIDPTYYHFMYHDTFQMYIEVLKSIKNSLSDNTISYLVEQGAPKNQAETDNILSEISKLKEKIDYATAYSEESSSILVQARLQSLKERLADIGNQLNVPTMQQYITQLESIDKDTASIMINLGSFDGIDDDGVRTLVYLINNINSSVQRELQDYGTDVVKIASALKFNENPIDIYERDFMKNTTGYIVRDLNYGLFYQDYRKFMADLNLSFGLSAENTNAPEKEEDRILWNKKRNEWLDEHCLRPFTKEYYDVLSSLSAEAQKLRSDIQDAIKQIKIKCLHEDGHYYFDELTEEDWKTLNDLYSQKKQLASDYDTNGELKDEHSLKIAREIQRVNDLLYKKGKIKFDIETWKNRRNQIIEECGGINKYKNNDPTFDYEKLAEWDYRNSKIRLKTDDDNNILLFKKIEQELVNATGGKTVVYSVDNDGGAKYEALMKKKNALLNVSRAYGTGDVDPNILPAETKAAIQRINKELYKLRRRAIRQNKELRQILKVKERIQKEYSKQVYTRTYLRMREKAKREDRINPGEYQKFERATVYYVDDGFGEYVAKVLPWFKMIVPTNKYEEEFMEILPGDGYIDPDDQSEYKNQEYTRLKEKEITLKSGTKIKPNESEPLIPRGNFDKGRYKNNDHFNKIISSETLSALYEITYKTISLCNSKFFNKRRVQNFLLPQMTGSQVRYVKAHGMSGVLDYMKDELGITNNNTDENLINTTGVGSQQVETDETGAVEKEQRVSGVRPDGSELRFIPQPYSTKMEHPELISADLVNMLMTYYEVALQFEQKAKIKDFCEMLIDQLYDREYIANHDGKLTPTVGHKTNTYKAARMFTNMHLYNIRRDPNSTGAKFTKSSNLLLKAISAINLGCNPAVALTGYFTTLSAHIINGLTGARYRFRDVLNGFCDAKASILKNGFGVKLISNSLTRDIVALQAELFNIANSGSHKFRHTNRIKGSEALRIVNAVNDNWCFGMMTATDYAAKTSIMRTVLRSYRLYEGEFCTLNDAIINKRAISKDEKNAVEQQWQKGKCLKDIFYEEDFKLKIQKEYLQQYEKVFHTVYSRIEKYSASYDGIATKTQKTAFATSMVGAFVMQHRQYLPKMLQERLAETVYDFDTQEWSNQGQFRSVYYLSKLMYSGIFDLITAKRGLSEFNKEAAKQGAKTGAALFSAPLSTFFGAYGGFLGAGIGSILGYIGAGMSSNKYEQTFGLSKDMDTKTFSLNSTRLQHLRKTQIELLGYNLVVMPLIEAFCYFIADDKKRKKNKLLQFIAFLLRRVQWETYNPYRPMDITNNIRSAFAGSSLLDVASSVANMTTPNKTLFGTFISDIQEDKMNNKISLGVYKGHSRAFRTMSKATPFHNMIEQYYDSYNKRNYFEHKIMGLKE